MTKPSLREEIEKILVEFIEDVRIKVKRIALEGKLPPRDKDGGYRLNFTDEGGKATTAILSAIKKRVPKKKAKHYSENLDIKPFPVVNLMRSWTPDEIKGYNLAIDDFTKGLD